MAEETPLDFRILGSLEVWRGEHRLEIGAPRQRQLLALLLLHRNQVVRTDRLVDLLWGSRPPPTAANTLHVLVSSIRRSLGDGRQSLLVTRRPGYELRTAPGQVDSERFEALRETAMSATDRGDHEAARRDLEHALALWRDDPLPELCDVVDVAGELGRLRELRITALEERIDADLAVGRHREIVPELELLVGQEPLRERPRSQLMLALYRSGRQTRALEVYREGRRWLVDELGVEPGPELRKLERAILQHDPAIGLRVDEPTRGQRRRLMTVALGVALLTVFVGLVWHSRTSDPRTAARSYGAAHSQPRHADSAAGMDEAEMVRGGRISVRSPLPGADAVAVSPSGDAWVASTHDGTITRVSPSGAQLTLGIGGRPTDVAWGFGRLWVGDAAERQLAAYDPALGRDVPTVHLARQVGPVGQPTAHLAIGAGSVWVDNGGLAGVWRVDPNTGKVIARIGHVQTGAMVFGGGAVWVAGNFFSSDRVDRIDPATNAVSDSIPLPSGTPVSIAYSDDQLWVVCDDGTLWRVDAKTRRVARVSMSGLPVSVAGGTRTVWVAQSDPARIVQIDALGSHTVSVAPLAGDPTATALASQGAWVTTVPAPPTSRQTRGGVITVALNTGVDSIDPAISQWATVWQMEYATGLRLLTYPDAPGRAGTRLVPDGAAAPPTVSDGGRTYTFTVRRGLRFWPGGQPVTAAAFRAAVERSLSPGVNSVFGRDFMGDLVGVDAYRDGKAVHIAGIRLYGRYRISFTTTTPDPSFPVNIAMPMYSAVPPATADSRATRPLPSAGPYYIATFEPGRLIVLRRNPGYQGARPAGVGEIRYRLGNANSEPGWKQVVDGLADADADPASPAQLEQLLSQGGSRLARVTLNAKPELRYLVLNTRSAALRNILVRRAISDAIDRRALAATIGADAAIPTDQYLVPALAGYPGNGLVDPLNRPRVGAARRLLQEAGIHLPLRLRMSSCNDPVCQADGVLERAALIRMELARVGIRLIVQNLPRNQQLAIDSSGRGFDIADEGFDFPNSDPQTIEFAVGLEAGYPPTAPIRVAEQTAYPKRAASWRALDLALARGASPLAAYAIANTINITSSRVGCLVYQPEYGLDLGRLCLTRRPRGK